MPAVLHSLPSTILPTWAHHCGLPSLRRVWWLESNADGPHLRHQRVGALLVGWAGVQLDGARPDTSRRWGLDPRRSSLVASQAEHAQANAGRDVSSTDGSAHPTGRRAVIDTRCSHVRCTGSSIVWPHPPAIRAHARCVPRRRCQQFPVQGLPLLALAVPPPQEARSHAAAPEGISQVSTSDLPC